MKIIIFVNEEHLENLHKFLRDGERNVVEYYHNRPGMGTFLMVSLDYDEFVKITDL